MTSFRLLVQCGQWRLNALHKRTNELQRGKNVCKTDILTMMGGRGERENLNYSPAVHVSQSIRNESTISFWWPPSFFLLLNSSEKRKKKSWPWKNEWMNNWFQHKYVPSSDWWWDNFHHITHMRGWACETKKEGGVATHQTTKMAPGEWWDDWTGWQNSFTRCEKENFIHSFSLFIHSFIFLLFCILIIKYLNCH